MCDTNSDYSCDEKRQSDTSLTSLNDLKLPSGASLEPTFEDSCNIGSDELLVSCRPKERKNIKQLPTEQRFQELSVFKKPQQLIYTDERNILVVNEHVLKEISQIDFPLNIVAICGHCRTGKSYLMNKLANEKTGFKVGSKVSTQTKGIWAWCKLHPQQDNQVLLLLDTEGMSDIKKGDRDHDNKLFCLATMLSSTLIYNHRGVFDQDSLEKLSFITKMSVHVKTANEQALTNEESEEIIPLLTPTFILCLRDFYFEFDDDKYNADKYFEEILEISVEPNKEEYNKTKECIIKFFPRRKCLTLSMPGINKLLPCLEQVNESALDKDFLSDVEKFKKFIYSCKPKVLDAMTEILVDGPAFVEVTKTYVEALANGSAMTFTRAFEQASINHNRNLVVKLVSEYKEEIELVELPVQKKKFLLHFCLDHMKITLQKFGKLAYPSQKDGFLEQAKNKMAVIREIKMKENREKVQAVLVDRLNYLHKKHIPSSTSRYNTTHGVEKYNRDIEQIELMFRKEMKEYDLDEQTAAIKTFEKNIYDKTMLVKYAARLRELKKSKEIEKKLLREALQRQLQRQIEEIKKEFKEVMEKERENMERNFTESMKNRKPTLFWKWFKLLFKS